MGYVLHCKRVDWKKQRLQPDNSIRIIEDAGRTPATLISNPFPSGIRASIRSGPWNGNAARSQSEHRGSIGQYSDMFTSFSFGIQKQLPWQIGN